MDANPTLSPLPARPSYPDSTHFQPNQNQMLLLDQAESGVISGSSLFLGRGGFVPQLVSNQDQNQRSFKVFLRKFN